jgi:hypothetical protein
LTEIKAYWTLRWTIGFEARGRAMPGRTNVIVALLVAVGALVASTQVQAQSCGQPPDPRYNTSGYASWCSCMGGSYNYQTTACVGAHGPSRGGNGPSANWGCYARASNGASGTSWSWSTEAGARGRAIAECRKVSRGRACTVRYCQRGTSASRRPAPQRTAPPPRRNARGEIVDTGNWGCYAQARNGRGGFSWGFRTESAARQRALSECRVYSGQGSCTVRSCQPGTSAQRPPSKKPVARTAPRQAPASRARTAYSCSLCEQKLRNDLLSGLGSARIQTYVRQAIAGYDNCKRKGEPPCTGGDILVRSVRNGCFGFGTDEPFRICVGRVLGR